jgi:hypothetical protein
LRSRVCARGLVAEYVFAAFCQQDVLKKESCRRRRKLFSRACVGAPSGWLSGGASPPEAEKFSVPRAACLGSGGGSELSQAATVVASIAASLSRFPFLLLLFLLLLLPPCTRCSWLYLDVPGCTPVYPDVPGVPGCTRVYSLSRNPLRCGAGPLRKWVAIVESTPLERCGAASKMGCYRGIHSVGAVRGRFGNGLLSWNPLPWSGAGPLRK